MNQSKLSMSTLITTLEQLYPPILAESWDQVGLHFGNRESEVRKIMTSLDVRPSVVKEAIDLGVDTLVVHHPVLFSPIRRMDNSTPLLQMYTDLVKADINVYVMHTNLDIANGGMNDWLSEALALSGCQPLHPEGEESAGLGRIGDLPQSMNRSDLLQYLKEALKAPQLTVIEEQPKTRYQRLAIVGGASFSSIDFAVQQGADVFVTGDVTYHRGHDGLDSGIMVIDAGHYIEHIFNKKMQERLNQLKQDNDWEIEVIESKTPTTPFTYE